MADGALLRAALTRILGAGPKATHEDVAWIRSCQLQMQHPLEYMHYYALIISILGFVEYAIALLSKQQFAFLFLSSAIC